ncbi:MAG: YdcF family protein [Candidatus Aenigmatarchaeota archaeon]
MKYDAIIVPGGGLDPNGTPHSWVKKRLDKALEVYTGKEFLIVLSRGTTHKPPILDKKGFPIDEATSSSEYLLKKGVDRKNIRAERSSFDTIGNAYFSRVIHTDPMGLKNILVVTSKFHMTRTKSIFKWIFNLEPLRVKYKIDFLESDDGMRANLTKLKHERERSRLNQIKERQKRIKTLLQLHEWLFTEHDAYSCGLKSTSLKGRILDTY